MHGDGITIQYRSGVLLALLFSGFGGCFLAGVLPVYASGTAAHTVIRSSASATYDNPDNSGTTLNTGSNIVTVTVAEVAGITIGAGMVSDTTVGHAGNILPGDVVNFDFLVTNIGNAPSAFSLPGAPTVTGSGVAGVSQYSLDGSTFVNIPSGGLNATSPVAAGGTVVVRVPVTVSLFAMTGDLLHVQLGNTGSNDNSADTQNIAYPDPSINNDLHTVSTTAQNGQREASFYQNATVGSQPQALALILLTRTGFAQNAIPAADTLTYGLVLKIISIPPTGPNASHALAAADLAPTSINLNGSGTSAILISDAIPLGTVFTSIAPPPAGWSAVYTTTPTTSKATDAQWTTTAPGALATVTRIGLITAGAISKGSSISGFSFVVTTTGASAIAPTDVYNIAQVFGQTRGDSTNTLVYDESGDQNPSCFNSDGSPGANTVYTGVANPAVDGIDTANDNTGTGAAPGGRDNSYRVIPNETVQNGPSGQPGTTGPTVSNETFTNLSTPIAAETTAGTTISPAAVTFTNMLRNPGTAALTSNILLLPAPPTAPGDLPTNTTVTLTCKNLSAVYSYSGTAWTLTSGAAISLPGLAPAESLNYTTTVHLPVGTPLSADTGIGFPVTILAGIDLNGNGLPDANEPQTRTIDRVYTGFLRVTQQQRIIAADGTTVLESDSSGSISDNIHAGQFIDYIITYTNISNGAGSAVGSIPLTASATDIIEDGAAGTNNWALTGPNGVLLTSNVPGSAIDSGGGTVTFYNGNPPLVGADKSGTTPAADVTKYVDTAAGPIAPGMSRTFTFRRRIN